MDVLSDVLMAVRLTAAVFFDVEARAPFAAESPDAETLSGGVIGGPQRVVSFHMVLEGACWAEVFGRGEPPVRVGAGEIVVFPLGDPHVMESAPGMRGDPEAASSLYAHAAQARSPERPLPFSLKMNHDADAERCRFVCGFFGFDARPFNPLLGALPPIVHAPGSERSRRLIASLAGAAVAECGGDGAGREAMLAKLAELMFVEAMRTHIDALPESARGWFAGLRDPAVGEALRLIHGRPTDPWTLDALARAVGLSRSSFADRFTGYVGTPPMLYLARWRLQIAARMLEGRGVSVAQAAAEAGYASEAAFNRAFKRHVGEAPGAWRRSRAEPARAAAGLRAGGRT